MARAAVTSAEPQLTVENLERALAFYGTLGFEAAFVYGEPPFYAQVRRGGAHLNLRLVHGPILADGLREREPTLRRRR